MCSTPIAIRNSFKRGGYDALDEAPCNRRRSHHSVGSFLIADVATLSAQAKVPRVGTWMLDVAKSKYSPGP